MAAKAEHVHDRFFLLAINFTYIIFRDLPTEERIFCSQNTITSLPNKVLNFVFQVQTPHPPLNFMHFRRVRAIGETTLSLNFLGQPISTPHREFTFYLQSKPFYPLLLIH